MSAITGRLIKGSMWLSLSRAIVNLLMMLSTFILARYLSPSDFGLVALGTTMLLIVSTVTELSLTQALIHHEQPTDAHFSTAWTLNAVRGVILFLFLAACAYPASLIYDDPRLVSVMVALGFSVFLSSLRNPRLVVLQRQLIFWQEFVLNVSERFMGFVAAVVIAVMFHTYWALVIGQIVGQVTNILTSYLVLPFRPKVTFRHMREFFSFSAWLAASQIVNTLNWRFDYLLVGKVLGGSALGYYTVGGRLARLPSHEATLPLTQTIFPTFASIRNDPPRLAAAYQRVQALVTAIALPAGIGVATVADPLIRLAMGDKWLPAVFITQALGAIFALQTLGSLVEPLGMAKGETRLLFMRDSQMFLVRVPVILLAMIFYGMPGVIAGRVFTGLLSIVVNMILVRRFTGIAVMRQLSANTRALASVAVMAAGVALCSSLLPVAPDKLALVSQLAVLVTLGAVLYCGCSLFLWLLMRRPAGPETEVMTIAGRIFTKVRPA